jgi:hypothetical protein
MKSRSILWLALCALGLPLLIEGTGGCTFGSPGAAPINDNAYTCGCTCFAPPRNTITAVFAGTDDAEQSGAVVNLGDADLDLGGQIVGLRFQGFLPPGATIKRASVGLMARESGSTATNVQIVGQLGAAPDLLLREQRPEQPARHRDHHRLGAGSLDRRLHPADT